MEKNELYKNYSGIHDHIQQYDESYYSKTADEYHHMYSEYLPKDKNAAILDIGCGNGIFLYYLKKQGFMNSIGIDLDQSSLDLVQNNVTTNVFKTNAFEFLDQKKDEFDLIVMNEVLEHINKDEIIPLISKINKALKPNGTYICYVPNMENPFTIYTRYHDFTHTIGFTQNSLKMVLRSGGFDEIKVLPATYDIKGFKRKLKKYLQIFIKNILVILFEYPKDGYLSAMRIYSVSKKK